QPSTTSAYEKGMKRKLHSKHDGDFSSTWSCLLVCAMHPPHSNPTSTRYCTTTSMFSVLHTSMTSSFSVRTRKNTRNRYDTLSSAWAKQAYTSISINASLASKRSITSD